MFLCAYAHLAFDDVIGSSECSIDVTVDNLVIILVVLAGGDAREGISLCGFVSERVDGERPRVGRVAGGWDGMVEGWDGIADGVAIGPVSIRWASLPHLYIATRPLNLHCSRDLCGKRSEIFVKKDPRSL